MTYLIVVKTADLAGEALGWAVGKAEGLDVYLEPPGYNGVPCRVFARYQGEAIVHTKRYNPREDWALGGQLIEQHKIKLSPYADRGWYADKVFPAEASVAGNVDWCGFGPTPLIALCRAYVAAKLGDTVQVPKELIPCQA
ncbi:DUF2591 domain-containing protein [Pseudomonas sp. SWI44]|uniref:DUF2591 domain-containing protein n=1 Tax=Pseudomonas sp. SWI44 TaxID=2083053 RepID=UPI000CE5ECD5|nr:DUF2591 domain-containing protein [Pseudomonas sp. SWI44]AVD86007.1 DUF2591 domain-containing protein [Pseudomonas sp. SWI44]